MRRRHAIRITHEHRTIEILHPEVPYVEEHCAQSFGKSRLDRTLVARRTDSDSVDSLLDSRLHLTDLGWGAPWISVGPV